MVSARTDVEHSSTGPDGRGPEGRGEEADPMPGSAPVPARRWFARVNPAAKVVAAVAIAAGLVPAVDPVTAGIVLAATLLLLPFAGLQRRVVLRLGLPLVLAGASVGVVNVLFGDAGPLMGLGMTMRLLAIALPGMLVAATCDPTELADALVQKLKVPQRPAMGVLAALRLLPLLAAQWRTLGLARRARGLEAGRNPFVAVRIFTGKAFALLVRSIRTGTTLAMAMDARAFNSGPRSHARISRWRRSDTSLVIGVIALLCVAHGLSLALGTWRSLFV